MLVQIYSLTSPADVDACAAAGVDHVGVAAGDQSVPAAVGNDRARGLFERAREAGMRTVALSVHREVDRIVEYARAVDPDVLHVASDTDIVAEAGLADLEDRVDAELMKAVGVGGAEAPPGSDRDDGDADADPVAGGAPDRGEGGDPDPGWGADSDHGRGSPGEGRSGDGRPGDGRSASEHPAVDRARRFAPHVDWLILDSETPAVEGVGAAGRTHDWSVSRRVVAAVDVPVILAGGLAPGNVADAVRAVRPAGVDSYTHTSESERRKDPEKVAAFVENARRAAADRDDGGADARTDGSGGTADDPGSDAGSAGARSDAGSSDPRTDAGGESTGADDDDGRR